MDEPNNQTRKDEGVKGDMEILKVVGSNLFMKWVEWAEKRVLVILLIWAFVLLYWKDQQLSNINEKFMNYLMEEKKVRKLSIQDKQEILKKLSDEEAN